MCRHSLSLHRSCRDACAVSLPCASVWVNGLGDDNVGATASVPCCGSCPQDQFWTRSAASSVDVREVEERAGPRSHLAVFVPIGDPFCEAPPTCHFRLSVTSKDPHGAKWLVSFHSTWFCLGQESSVLSLRDKTDTFRGKVIRTKSAALCTHLGRPPDWSSQCGKDNFHRCSERVSASLGDSISVFTTPLLRSCPY